MDKRTFNLKFLAALASIHPKLKHIPTGTGGKHPLLRAVLLRAVKEDIQMDGLELAIEKWKHFIKGGE